MSLSVRTFAVGIATAAGLVASAGLALSAPAPAASPTASPTAWPTASPTANPANTVLLAGCHRWWDDRGRHHYYCHYRHRDGDNGLIILHGIL